MNHLDEIFRKRLERIRIELDAYLDERRSGGTTMDSAPDTDQATWERKSDGVFADLFLRYMKLAGEDEADFDDSYDDDFDENKEYHPPQPKEAGNEINPAAEVPRRLTSELPRYSQVKPSERLHIPDFLKKGKKCPKLDQVLEQKKMSFSTMLLHMIDEKGLKDSEVYKRANIDRRLFSKIRSDPNYVPSKKTAISFCLALQLKLDEAGTLLETAGYVLSASSRFDLIIMYLIENNEYNVQFVNIVLDDYGEGTLSR